jgi:uncharacterized membrane protein (DUF4010 family)
MFEVAKPFLLSLALGLMVGIERERSVRGDEAHLPFGARTFTLISLLGAMAAYIGNAGLAVALGAFVAAIAVAAYLRAAAGARQDAGTTTEVAAVLTFALGFLAVSEPRLAAMIGVIVVGVLWMKPRIHAFAHQGLTDQEVKAALTFLVIALVVLPLLPNRTVDPWGIANPSRLWLLFVLIAGVGFGGYIAVRALGPGRGLAAAGFFAGLVSSTAATLSLSRRAKAEPALAGPLATGIVLANVASAVAQLLVVAVAGPALLHDAAILLGAPIGVGAAGAAIAASILARRHDASPESGMGLSSPLDLKPAFVMAGMFALVLAATALAGRVFGAYGVTVTAAIAGTTDVHAATLATATLSAAGKIGSGEALLAILVAFVVNMIVKLTIARIAGGRRLLLIVGPPLAGMAASAIVAFWLLARVPRP